MKYIIILLILFWTVSCKVEQDFSINSNFQVGTQKLPTVYWAIIPAKEPISSQQRAVMIYFFDNNKVLYRLMPVECIGGSYFIGTTKIVNDIIMIEKPENGFGDIEYKNKFIYPELTILNDSTLVNSEKIEFKKVESNRMHGEWVRHYQKENFVH